MQAYVFDGFIEGFLKLTLLEEERNALLVSANELSTESNKISEESNELDTARNEKLDTQNSHLFDVKFELHRIASSFKLLNHFLIVKVNAWLQKTLNNARKLAGTVHSIYAQASDRGLGIWVNDQIHERDDHAQERQRIAQAAFDIAMQESGKIEQIKERINDPVQWVEPGMHWKR